MPDRVDVALDVVAAERIARAQGRLEVDLRARLRAVRASCARIVSGTAWKVSRPSATDVTVRQAPPIETESPTPLSAAVSGASSSSASPSGPPSARTTRPRSRTIPVNIEGTLALAEGDGFERLAGHHLQVPALAVLRLRELLLQLLARPPRGRARGRRSRSRRSGAAARPSAAGRRASSRAG